jgi:hypothetical protein
MRQTIWLDYGDGKTMRTPSSRFRSVTRIVVVSSGERAMIQAANAENCQSHQTIYRFSCQTQHFHANASR